MRGSEGGREAGRQAGGKTEREEGSGRKKNWEHQKRASSPNKDITTRRLATLPMSPAAATPANPNSKSSPVVSVAEGVMQGPVEEHGSGGSTITCETEGLGSGE